MAVHRWRLEDPADPDPETRVFTFPVNPNRMTSPFPKKAITAQGTTAVDGRPILWEAATPPTEWSFGGAILTPEHFEALRSWVYDRSGRLYLWDHFGRRLTVVLKEFAPEPKRSVGKYWRHDYTINGLVLAILAPTVGEVSP